VISIGEAILFEEISRYDALKPNDLSTLHMLFLMSMKAVLDEDLVWYIEHPEAFEKYRGKHVAIWKRSVIGHGNTAKKAYEMAKKGHPESEPTLAFIPKEEELILIT